MGLYIHIYLFIYLFIKALQHKCWRSVGHQVLQPDKDDKLGQYVWKVVDIDNAWYKPPLFKWKHNSYAILLGVNCDTSYELHCSKSIIISNSEWINYVH